MRKLIAYMIVFAMIISAQFVTTTQVTANPFLWAFLRSLATNAGKSAAKSALKKGVKQAARRGVNSLKQGARALGNTARASAVKSARKAGRAAHASVRGLGEVAKHAAIQSLVTAGTVIRVGAYAYVAADIFTSIASAGYIPHAIPNQQAIVLIEITNAIKAGKEVYIPKVCLDHEMHRFYTVPRNTKKCPSGKPPRDGSPIDLYELKPIGRMPA